MPVRIQSVSRALHILDTLTQYPEGLGVVDIANGLYRLGHAVARLYGSYRQVQQPEARLETVLNQLVSKIQETGYLAGWQGDEVVIQAIAEGSQQLRAIRLFLAVRVASIRRRCVVR